MITLTITEANRDEALALVQQYWREGARVGGLDTAAWEEDGDEPIMYDVDVDAGEPTIGTYGDVRALLVPIRFPRGGEGSKEIFDTKPIWASMTLFIEPSKGGRPMVGPAISIKIPEVTLRDIEQAAREQGMSRAEWIREACNQALASKPDPEPVVVGYVRIADEGYEGDEDRGKAVVEDAHGEWIATLEGVELGALDVEQVEALVAPHLGEVTATPTGANTTGDISHRNLYTTSLEWTLTR